MTDEFDNWEDSDEYDLMDQRLDDDTIYDYTPPSMLEIPKHIKETFKAKGFYLKWKRFRIGPNGGYDSKNIRRATSRNEGFSFVAPEEFSQEDLLEIGEVEQYGNGSVITNGDLVLMKVAIGKAEARRAYYEQKTKNASEAIQHQLQNQDIINKSKSIVKTGRNAKFSTNT